MREKISKFNLPDIDTEQIDERVERLVSDYEEHIIKHINSEYQRKISWSDRFADKIASFGGSWKFITTFGFLLILWIAWNLVNFTVHFDEPPFILLNLILSFVAGFQAPIILMSQNRHAEHDKLEAVIDFAINYKAEQEIADIQNHLHTLEKEVQDIKAMLGKLICSKN
ncbi:MAG: DUF1003 domain-containing protein [Peptococcaceae bacterium]|nr:DUF1003 domain-containing protein [Peptococcaceae bacterium]